MIARVLRFSIEHRVLVILTGIVFSAWGLYATSQVPVDAIPDLSDKQVIVYADWPGHSPREIDDLVTYPMSVEIQGIRGVRVVRATSDPGYSWLTIILEDSADYSVVRQALAQRLPNVNRKLPEGVVARLAPEMAATGQIYWYTVEGGGLDLGRLRAIQDFYVGPQLSTVPGVAEVASVGGASMEYQVEVDPVRLASRGVTLEAVVRAVADSNSAVGGGVVHKAGAEFVVRGVNWLGASSESTDGDHSQVIRDLERVPVPPVRGGTVPLSELAHVGLGSRPRRGTLEKDGVEVTGGVIQMAIGENPRRVTERIKEKIRELSPGLPKGVSVIPFYDRTPLIDGAIATVTSSVVEAMATATLCVLVVLLHLRASFVIAITLPLAALGSFGLIWALRVAGIADVQINIMSLAGIAISIGVLVDSSIVITENVMHRLRERFGDHPVSGDVRDTVLVACQQVGRPIFFSIVIMLLSFLPVFALGGMEGRMFYPLAVAKCFCLVVVAVLAITLVPALCTFLIRGRLRTEMQSPLMRAIIEVYRPVLSYLLDRPAPLLWILGVTFILAAATIGSKPVFLAVVAGSLLVNGWVVPGAARRLAILASLALIAVWADHNIKPLDREFITPLDEGMVMDMPITVPRASVTGSTDDVKARDMILCRFPEVTMVVGKVGRAESPSDPAPLDMIETMIEFRPRDRWPRRVLKDADARRHARAILDRLESVKLVRHVQPAALASVLDDVTSAALSRYDALMREYAYQRNLEFLRTSGVAGAHLTLDGEPQSLDRLWKQHMDRLDNELVSRGAATFTRVAMERCIARCGTDRLDLARYLDAIERWRYQQQSFGHHHVSNDAMSRTANVPAHIEPQPEFDALQRELTLEFERGLVLFRRERHELIGFGGELDRAVPMPGWVNVWTTPIQNRVNMLATGVNTAVGVRVLGANLADVVGVSDTIAEVVKSIPGATDVVSDPIRGKGTIEVRVDRDRAAALGVSAASVSETVEKAIGGQIATTTVEGRERHPVRVRYGRAWREDEESIRRVAIPVRSRENEQAHRLVAVDDVATVSVVEGPATIKSENGRLRNYVRLNVRGRPIGGFLEDARKAVAAKVPLPPGTHVEWTGQFEYEERTRATLMLVVPVVILVIFAILCATYRDVADALTILMTVPGAAAGGLLFQAVTGTKFSATVWIGYIACFGMATSTGIIMIVYLRDAVDRAGGLRKLDIETLRKAVLEGAVHRLRPKLLTEGTTLLALAPLLWSQGVASEVIRPMVAPVLGGILIADEIIDLLLPLIFYHVRRRRMMKLPTQIPAPSAGIPTPAPVS